MQELVMQVQIVQDLFMLQNIFYNLLNILLPLPPDWTLQIIRLQKQESSTSGSKRHSMSLQILLHYDRITECNDPDSKPHGANMGPTWVLSAPDGPHVARWTLLWGISMLHWTFLLDIYSVVWIVLGFFWPDRVRWGLIDPHRTGTFLCSIEYKVGE